MNYFRGNAKAFVFLAALFVVTISAHFFVIINPGFFNHDEWQRYDHIYSYNFWHFVETVGRLRAGKEFGAPVRPLGFIQQGFSAIFMVSNPWITHLIDVLIHFADMLVFYLLLTRLGVDRILRNVAALLFVLSPLGIFATAWVGASFDRLYVLFSMMAIYFALGILQDKKNRLQTSDRKLGAVILNGVGLFICAFLAIISKETALMLPVLIVVGCVCMNGSVGIGQLLRDKYFYFISLLAGVPILIFLIIRAPAIYNTLFVYASPEYSPQLSFLCRNVLYYFAYPFYWGTSDMYSMLVEAKMPAFVAVLVHFSVVYLLAWRASFKISLAYISLYFVFLFPVIFLQSISAHYLYSTTPVLSLALAYLICDFIKTKRHMLLVVLGIIILFSLYRFSQIQIVFYEDGVCQVKYISTLDESLVHARALKPIMTVNIQGETGAKLYVASVLCLGAVKMVLTKVWFSLQIQIIQLVMT